MQLELKFLYFRMEDNSESCFDNLILKRCQGLGQCNFAAKRQEDLIRHAQCTHLLGGSDLETYISNLDHVYSRSVSEKY